MTPEFDERLVVEFESPVERDEDFEMKKIDTYIKAGVYTVDEARQMLGLPPKPKPDPAEAQVTQPQPAPMQQQGKVMKCGGEGGTPGPCPEHGHDDKPGKGGGKEDGPKSDEKARSALGQIGSAGVGAS